MRIKYLKINMRIIGLSATLNNVPLLAKWLNAKYYQFDESYRSIQIACHVEYFDGDDDGTNVYSFLNCNVDKVGPLIEAHFENRPTLVFVPTTSLVEKVAHSLLNLDKFWTHSSIR